MTIIGYIRVSTGKQKEDGISLEAQEAMIRKWCEQSGHAPPTIFSADAGLSGGSTHKRADFHRAVDLVCQKKGILVVYSLYRLCRSTKDSIDTVERIQKAGGMVVSLSERIDTTTASGNLQFQMMAVIGEWERRAIAERTKAGLAHLKKIGRKYAQVPYGWRCVQRDDREHLVEDETQQSVISQIRRLSEAGYVLRDIAEELNLDGHPSPNAGRLKRDGSPLCSGRWTHSSVASVLKTVKTMPVLEGV